MGLALLIFSVLPRKELESWSRNRQLNRFPDRFGRARGVLAEPEVLCDS
jgi:hypothetical protein